MSATGWALRDVLAVSIILEVMGSLQLTAAEDQPSGHRRTAVDYLASSSHERSLCTGTMLSFT